MSEILVNYFPRELFMSEIKMVYNGYTGHSMDVENIIVKGGFKR